MNKSKASKSREAAQDTVIAVITTVLFLVICLGIVVAVTVGFEEFVVIVSSYIAGAVTSQFILAFGEKRPDQ